jgi:3-carboxy-cis,cis-muconate cycloisomerase
MRDNLGSTSGMISAEAVMMKLAPMMGRQRAHDVVYDCCREAERERISFLDALSKNSEIARVAERDALAAMVDPTNYLGTATRMIDRLLMARAENRVLPLNLLGSI